MKPDRNCKLCKLSATANTVCLLGRGPEPNDVMVIGEAPGKQEDETGEAFVGKAGKILERLLADAGIHKPFITNAVSCRPPDNRTPSKAEIKACKKWLDYQIAMVKPKFVILLGNVPLMAITGEAGITKRRGKPFVKDGITYMATFHPAAIFHDPLKEDVIAQDIDFFGHIVEIGKIPEEDGLNMRIVRTWADVGEMIADLQGTVSVDTETTGLYQWAKGARIVSYGIGTARTQWCVPVWHSESPWNEDDIETIVARVAEALEDCILVFANAKFDILWWWVHFGIWLYASHDTMLQHYLLDENDLHGLKYLARKYYGAPDYEIDKTEKQGINVPLERHCRYLAHDLFYTRKLRFTLGRQMLKEPRVKEVYDHILMPCSRLFVEIEYDGVFINIEQMDAAEKKLRSDLRRARRNLHQWGRINWGSTKQLAKLLYEDLGLEAPEKTKKGNPSCSESSLKQLDHPCVADLLKYRAAKQQLSFFIDGWKPYLDGRYLHPSFKLHGTVTGRLSCEHPNLQQVPRDPFIRSLISAPKGWVLMEADLSQIELRIAAELAGEQAMLYAFANGIDVHWLTAIGEIERAGAQREIVINTAWEYAQKKGPKPKYADAIQSLFDMGPEQACELNPLWKELRKKAKAINFGYLYGMWWKKFKLYARDNYDVIVSDEEAQASRVAFFSKYKYADWHNRQKKFVRRHGYVESLSGRKRRLPDAMSPHDSPSRGAAERQAINSPVQSFANELNLMAALQLRDEFGRNVVRLCGTVHDSLLIRVKEEYVERVHDRVMEIMRHPKLMDTLDIKIRVPIEAEVKIGPWGKGVSLKKWKLAA